MAAREIGIDEAAERLAGGRVRLVDCREEEEFAICRIDGAELIPLSVFGYEATSKLGDRDQEIIIYCHHGMRSLTAARYLAERGYSNVASMAGGIDAWAHRREPEMTRY